MKKYLVANWKINPGSAQAALRLAGSYKFSDKIKKQVVVCPPNIFLPDLIRNFESKFSFGAQNLFWESGGAFTGETSPQILKTFGVKYALVGHSERREHLGETDVMVRRKFEAALSAGLIPILCVGGGKEAKSKRVSPAKVIFRQTYAVLGKLSKNTLSRKKWMLTFEPPWALSTISNNKAAPTKLIAQSMTGMRRLVEKLLGRKIGRNIPVLYGGSANAGNIREISQAAQGQGFLVGGASLRPKEFNEMVQTYMK